MLREAGRISVSGFLNEPLRSWLTPVEPALQRLLSINRLRELYREAASGADHGSGAVPRLLDLLGIGYRVDPGELERVPRQGAVVVVANHPFGLLEGAILAAMLPKIRPDARILANSLLAEIPELRERCIFIDPFGRKESVGGNAGALRECYSWLRQGGLVAAFPAGEVAHLDWRCGDLTDPRWNPSIVAVGRRAGAAVVPVFFEGSNSLAFQLAGVVPGLRTASLGRELLNKSGRIVQVRIGRPVQPDRLRSYPDAAQVTEYLRCRTYLLSPSKSTGPVGLRLPFPPKKVPPVAPAPSSQLLANEIARLTPDRRLCESGDLAVYLGSSGEFPTVLREIGRLREIAFRGVGEGTGKPLDLDRFDDYYQHLVLWNEKTREVVGGYRLGPTEDILPRYGVRGLYTSTLFRFRKTLFEKLGPAVELGRSFVRPEYQKQYAPLLLLWKGIGRYVALRPECAVLFGGVSISRDYHPVSRHLLVKFLEAHRLEELASLVDPRRPYRPAARVLLRTGFPPRIPQEIEELSSLIGELESDGKGVPVLIKQYLKTGGRLLGFNVDPGFADVLDALIMVDLKKAPQPLLERCLGKPGAANFAGWHGTGR